MAQSADGEQRIALVTIGENRVFPLITELFQSTKSVGLGDRVSLCVVDHGLTSIQSEALKAQGVTIHAPAAEIQLKPKQRSGHPLEQGAMSKGFLPTYFPGHDVFVFVDSRTWWQSSAAFDLLVQGARRGALAIVSSQSRYRVRTQPLEWIGAGLVRLRSPLYQSARRAHLRRESVRQLANRPALNADVFALSKDAPHWDSIQNWLREALKRGSLGGADQLAFSAAAFLDGLPLEILPEWCNYQGPWRIDGTGTELVEFHLPHTPASLISFKSFPEMAADASVTIPILDTDGHVHHKSLRYSHWSDRRFAKESGGAGRDALRSSRTAS